MIKKTDFITKNENMQIQGLKRKIYIKNIKKVKNTK